MLSSTQGNLTVLGMEGSAPPPQWPALLFLLLPCPPDAPHLLGWEWLENLYPFPPGDFIIPPEPQSLALGRAGPSGMLDLICISLPTKVLCVMMEQVSCIC